MTGDKSKKNKIYERGKTMCLGIPGRVVKVDEKTGFVDVMGASREISFELLDDVKKGDYVLIHAGCAIEKLDRKEALKTLELFKELKIEG